MTTDTALIVTRDELMAIDESEVRMLCGERVFAEAEAIVGHLTSPTRNGLTIEAGVKNERGWPMTVKVAFGLAQLGDACGCRSSDRLCAHVGALLILWARSPGAFAVVGEPQERFSVTRKWGGERPDRLYRPPSHDAQFELRLLLSSMLVADLRNLGRRLELRLRGSAKSDLVDQLVAALSDPTHVERSVAALSSDLRLALAAVYALGEERGASAQRVKVALNRLVSTGPGGDSLVGELYARGLVFNRGEPGEPWLYQVPSAFRPHLPPIDVVDHAAKPDEPTRPAGSLADSLLDAWSSVRGGQLRLTARAVTLPEMIARAYPQLQDPGYVREEVEALARSDQWVGQTHELTVPRRHCPLSDESLRELAERVGGAERAALAWNLLAVLGLVEPGEVTGATDAAARDLLWLGPLGRLHAVLVAWLHLTGWSELDLALSTNPHLRLRRRLKVGVSSYVADWIGQEDLDEALLEARRFVARILGLLPEGVWLRTESLLNLIWRLWPDFLYSERGYGDRGYGGRGHGSKSDWWPEADGRRVDSARFSDWVGGPGAVIVAIVAGPLHWLGFADLAGPADHPTAFRLRPQARLLRGGDVPAEATLAPIELGPDLDVRVAAGHPDPELRDLLSTAGRLLETSASGFRYRLAPEGVRSLFEAGRSADDLLELLGRRAEAVPEELRTTIERWWQRYTQLRLAEGLTLIELSDDQLLDELLIATSLRRHLIHRFTPRLLAVDPAGADELFAEMRGRGYTPLIEPLDADRADGAKLARSGGT